MSRPLRLRGRGAFAALREHRMSSSASGLRVTAAPNGLGRLRLAFSIPRRAGTAVVRNRLRRRLRVALERHHAALEGWDVLVSAAPAVAASDVASLGAALERCLGVLGVRPRDAVAIEARENGPTVRAPRPAAPMLGCGGPAGR